MSGVLSNPAHPIGAKPRVRLHRDVIHRRARIAAGLLGFGYALLACKLVYLQIVCHHKYQLEAAAIRQHTFLLPAMRGSILDRNGLPLAVNMTVGDVVADPTAIVNPAATAAMLSKVLAQSAPPPTSDSSAPVPTSDLLAQEIAAAQAKRTAKNEPIKFAMLQKAISYEQVEALQAEMRAEQKAHIANAQNSVDLAGISLETRQVRSYPNGDLAAQVVGFVNQGQAGRAGSAGINGEYGVEKSMNAILAGRDGSVTAETDAQGRIIPGTETSRSNAVNGQDIRLTIDSNIQRIAQDELEKSWAAHHAATGTVVVIDPTNGDILALASLPTFDPNQIKNTTNLQWHNAAVTDLYEPGSTMKTLTLSACMDAEGLQHQHDLIVCNGALQVGNHVIHCAKDPPTFGHHGVEDMRKVLENSCNVGAAQYGMRLGAEKLFEYEGRFGLLHRPGTGLPGEQYCHLKGPDVKPWSKIELANIAFGQGISMTPMQLASIYATIANNGVVVHPHIALGQAYNGPVEHAVKPQVAQAMLSMLQSVVQAGTGMPAQVAGYNVGGKTGSAQMAEHGHYGDQYVGSFCGVAPLTHPRLVILCAIFKPQGVHWGAVVAAPVVHNIAQRALWYLKLPPDNPNMPDESVIMKDKTVAHPSTFVPDESFATASAPTTAAG